MKCKRFTMVELLAVIDILRIIMATIVVVKTDKRKAYTKVCSDC